MSGNGRSFEEMWGVRMGQAPPDNTIDANRRDRAGLPEPAPQEDDQTYQAFGTTLEPGHHLLDVRTGDGDGELFPLHHLMRVTYTQGRFISLAFPDCIVTLEGEGLGELVKALHARRVDFVQVYDTRSHKNAYGALISSIQINETRREI